MPIIPPHDLEAEKAILGAIPMDNEILVKLSLSPDDFYHPAHRKYFAAYLDLQRESAPIDLVTLHKILGDDEILQINQLTTDYAMAANIGHYEKLLIEYSERRQIYKACVEAAGMMHGSTAEVIGQFLQGSIIKILSRRTADLVHISKIATEVAAYVQRRAEHKGEISGVPSGLQAVDDITDGFQPGDLIILAGRPGTGKSAFAMQIAQYAAAKNLPCGFVSLEMGEHQLGIRTLASYSSLPLTVLRKGVLAKMDWDKMNNAAAKMHSLPIWFSFAATESKSIGKAMTAMVQEKGCKLIFLDYIQLARANDVRSREREVAEISLLCKHVARSQNIPVIALAQLNRLVEREKREPLLSDLRDSGAIEQDADVVIFLHQPKDDDIPAGLLKVIFAKGRNLGTGVCNIFFDKQFMRFGDYTERT